MDAKMLWDFMEYFNLANDVFIIDLWDHGMSFRKITSDGKEMHYDLNDDGKWSISTFINRNNGTTDIDEVILAKGDMGGIVC